MQYTKVSLKNRIKEYLLAKGFTQTDLAQALDVSPVQVTRWISGVEPSAINRARICTILDVDPHHIFYLEATTL